MHSLSFPPSLSLLSSSLFTHIVKLGAIPAKANLPHLPATANAPAVPGVLATSSTLATSLLSDSASALLDLLLPKQGPSTRETKVWIGDGLPAIPKKVYNIIASWEFDDLSELKPAGTLDAINPDPDPQKYIVLPGLEITQARRKPIRDIIMWIQCFAVIMAAVYKQDPAAVKELLAYMFTIIRAAQVFEDPAWRNYDKAFHENAAATGNRKWSEILLSTIEFSLAMPRNFNYLHPTVPTVLTPLRPTPSQPPCKCHKSITQTRPHLSALHQCHLQEVIYAISSIGIHAAMGAFANSGTCLVCSGCHPKVSRKAGKPSPTLQGLKDQGPVKL